MFSKDTFRKSALCCKELCEPSVQHVKSKTVFGTREFMAILPKRRYTDKGRLKSQNLVLVKPMTRENNRDDNLSSVSMTTMNHDMQKRNVY